MFVVYVVVLVYFKSVRGYIKCAWLPAIPTCHWNLTVAYYVIVLRAGGEILRENVIKDK